MSRPFEVGDRVRIVSLDFGDMWYFPSEDQGLVIGGTGTVNEVDDDCISVETDAPESLMNDQGHGWSFAPQMLELVELQ